MYSFRAASRCKRGTYSQYTAMIPTMKVTLTTKVNSEVRQSESTGMLIFTPAFVVSYISRTMTLEPGDVISMGTPGGVGVFRDPPVFRKSGDVVAITIDKIGTLTNPVA